MRRCVDLDSSGDGKLSHNELEQALVELDINITTAQARALVNFMGERSLRALAVLGCLDAEVGGVHCVGTDHRVGSNREVKP